MTDLQEADFLFCDTLQSPREICHFLITASFFQPGKTAIHFHIQKKNVNVVTRYKVNGHILKSQTAESPVNVANVIV